jgi:hypothetical protein
MHLLSRIIAVFTHRRAERGTSIVPHYRDPRVSWWQYPCDGGLTIIVEVGRPSFRRGEGHRPLRAFIEPDDLGSEIEEKADRIKELGPDDFKLQVAQGKFTRIC